MRVALARLAAEEVHLLILDEPTNHLDIFSIDALIHALRNFQGAVVFATHDRHLLYDIAHVIVTIRDSGIQLETVRQASEQVKVGKRDRTWKELLPPEQDGPD